MTLSLCVAANIQSGLVPMLFILISGIRKQVIAVKCQFCKIFKRKSSQVKILKLLSFAKFNCAFDDIFLKFLWSKLNFLEENQTSIWTKKVIQCLFGISCIERILNYQIYDNFNTSPTHCESFRQITQIHYLWCGYE